MTVRRPIDAIFFDRDGVVNEVVMREGVVSSPRSWDEFRIRLDFAQFHSALRGKSVRLFVVSNQPDISRNLLDIADLARMDAEMKRQFEFDEIMYCTHDNGDECECRKPRPGMIISLLQKHGLHRDRVVFVGDGEKDVMAGRAAGVPTILLKRPYNAHVQAEFTVDTLREILDLVTFSEDHK